MRVALIGPVPPRLGGLTPGGVATHQVCLAERLAAAGVEVALLATNTSVDPRCWRTENTEPPYTLCRMPARRSAGLAVLDGTTSGVDALRYLPRVIGTRTLGSRAEVLRNTLAYGRFLKEVRPDVIHVQHPLERCTYARLVRDAEAWRQPLVVTAHSLFGEHEDGTIHAFMAPNLRAADRVIAVSEHIAEQAAALGVDRQRIRTIRSGVDTARFRPRDRVAARQRLAVAQDACVVLFVGNLEPRKQVDVLLRSVAQARPQVPSLLVLIVGSGESAGALDQTAYLRGLTSELVLTDVVRFAGRLGEDELMDAYAAADVFALPSSSEAQGIVALEAMACGLPVIATSVGGLVGTIEDGRTGFLTRSADVSALAQRLVELLADAARREAMGAAARAAVEARFSWQQAVEETVAVYRELVGT